jgi:hypothetical protein
MISCKVERLEGASVDVAGSRPCIYQTRSYLSACMLWMKNVWICEVAEIADLLIWLICGFANLVDLRIC